MIDEARCPSCSGNVCESERTPGQSQVRTWMKEQTLAFRLTNISHNTAKKGRGDVSGCHLIRKGCLPCDTRKIDFLRVTAAARCPLLPFEAFTHNTCIWKFSILYTEGAHAGVNFLCPGFWCLARVGGKSTIGFGQRVSALRHCVCRRPRVHAGIFGHNAPIDDLCCVSWNGSCRGISSLASWLRSVAIIDIPSPNLCYRCQAASESASCTVL